MNGSVDILVTKGRSHTITLHEGQTLLLGKGNGSDISGTRIISNKPLTVITGHECGSTPKMIKRICHHLQLQVPPTITWGKSFILTNFIHYRGLPLSYVKVVTSQADTTVDVYCNGATNTTRYSVGAVGTYHYNITEYCFIEADKPIFVVQFRHSYFNYYYLTSMVLLSPMEQYLQAIEFDLHFYWYHGYSRLVITTSVEGFSPTAILHNGQATLNWAAIYDSSRNIVAYGTKIVITRLLSNHSVIHTGRNGKLSVQVQISGDRRSHFFSTLGYAAVVSLQPSNYTIDN